MKRGGAILCALGCALLWPTAPQAALKFKRCGDFGFRCARLPVPLDRSGAVPGRVSLLVKRLPARRRPRRGATFVLAGGPGQSATDAFDGDGLGLLSAANRRRDLIVFDQRGTGRSGLLRCRGLERSNLLRPGPAAAGCANRLGPSRAFYSTSDSVEDIEAVRRRLGVARIALYGTSYGTKVALAYAIRYPAAVERLVLDSVVAVDGPDPFYRSTFQATPRALAALCRSGCRAITSDPVNDLRQVLAKLAPGPLRGTRIDARGRRRRAALRHGDVLMALLAGDIDPALRAAFPAAVRSVLNGDLAPMLRLKRRAQEVDAEPPPPDIISSAVYAATTCLDTPFPWSPAAAPVDRRRQAEAAAAAIPASAFAPFDRLAALESDLLAVCEGWPGSPGRRLPTGPLPDVPVLILEGEDDLRTPLEDARRVAARFPRATLLLAPNTGHSALGTAPGRCLPRAFANFFLGRRLPSRCRSRKRDFPPDPVAPTTLDQVRPARGVPGARGRAIAALARTLADVNEDSFSSLIDEDVLDQARGGGLRGGRYRLDVDGTLVMTRVQYVPGVRVSGRIREFGDPVQRGRVRIAGRGVPRGRLSIRGNRVRGRLGGRRVRARLRPSAVSALAAAARHRDAPAIGVPPVPRPR